MPSDIPVNLFPGEFLSANCYDGIRSLILLALVLIVATFSGFNFISSYDFRHLITLVDSITASFKFSLCMQMLILFSFFFALIFWHSFYFFCSLLLSSNGDTVARLAI